MVLLGGTFDPVHDGHVVAAGALRAAVGAAAAWLVPSAVPPHRRPPVASAADRLELVRLAVTAEPGLLACDREVVRGGVSYTVDTVADLQGRDPDTRFWLALGADAARSLAGWERAGELARRVRFLLYDRPGVAPLDPGALAGILVPGGWERAAIAVPAISATQVRARLARGDACDDVLPPPVAAHIAARGWYRSPGGKGPALPRSRSEPGRVG